MNRRRIHAVAPIRVCDLGGWTDTWFAGHGRVTSLAVLPGVEVRLDAGPRAATGEVARIHAIGLGEPFVVAPGRPVPEAHRLLAATVEEAGVPAEVSVDVRISSDIPAGASTGTSAAAAVALLGALDALRDDRRSPAAVAAAAHRVEVDRLGLQSGVQDQLASAHGGVNHIVIDEYPRARVEPIAVDPSVADRLERRLRLVLLGRAHHSSAVHDEVIAGLAGRGPEAPALESLRRSAVEGRDALADGDLTGFGRAMAANTAAQAELHDDLVSRDARRVIDLARAHGALGWKVNGAGGPGGSLTVLLGDVGEGDGDFAAAVAEADARFAVRSLRLSVRGLSCRESTV
jgi:D-glycero-alpha-D-manno-heptose-7-phosphate kinase